MKLEHVPRVLITPEAYRRINLYITVANEEISGFGRVNYDGSDFLVHEVCIFEQEVSSAHTELDQEVLGRWLEKMVAEGHDPAVWKLWWHSHVNGSTYFSGVDEKNMSNWDNGWMLGHVGNKKGEHRFRLDTYNPRLTIDEMPWALWVPAREGEKDEVAEEVKTLVTSGWRGGSSWRKSGKGNKWCADCAETTDHYTSAHDDKKHGKGPRKEDKKWCFVCKTTTDHNGKEHEKALEEAAEARARHADPTKVTESWCVYCDSWHAELSREINSTTTSVTSPYQFSNEDLFNLPEEWSRVKDMSEEDYAKWLDEEYELLDEIDDALTNEQLQFRIDQLDLYTGIRKGEEQIPASKKLPTKKLPIKPLDEEDDTYWETVVAMTEEEFEAHLAEKYGDKHAIVRRGQ